MRTSALIVICFSVFAFCGFLSAASAAPFGKYNQSHLEWKVTETKHFKFYYTRTSNTSYLLQIATRLLKNLTFFMVGNRKIIGVTVLGYTSFANGFAEYSKDRITIFPTAPDFTTEAASRGLMVCLPMNSAISSH